MVAKSKDEKLNIKDNKKMHIMLSFKKEEMELFYDIHKYYNAPVPDIKAAIKADIEKRKRIASGETPMQTFDSGILNQYEDD